MHKLCKWASRIYPILCLACIIWVKRHMSSVYVQMDVFDDTKISRHHYWIYFLSGSLWNSQAIWRHTFYILVKHTLRVFHLRQARPVLLNALHLPLFFFFFCYGLRLFYPNLCFLLISFFYWWSNVWAKWVSNRSHAASSIWQLRSLHQNHLSFFSIIL